MQFNRLLNNWIQVATQIFYAKQLLWMWYTSLLVISNFNHYLYMYYLYFQIFNLCCILCSLWMKQTECNHVYMYVYVQEAQWAYTSHLHDFISTEVEWYGYEKFQILVSPIINAWLIFLNSLCKYRFITGGICPWHFDYDVILCEQYTQQYTYFSITQIHLFSTVFTIPHKWWIILIYINSNKMSPSSVRHHRVISNNSY